MKKRMRLSPKNKIQLSVRFRLLALASVFVLAAIVFGLYIFFDSNKEIVASTVQNFTERFAFYRSIEAIDVEGNEESDLYQIPVNVILEHNDFKAINAGGRLFDPSARDLVFTRRGNKTPLKSQIEDYDASRGIVHATVWIDTLMKNENPHFDIYYSQASNNAASLPFTGNNLVISMNDGISGHKGPERINATAVGTFKANGLMGHGRGFSNERGDYLQYNINPKNALETQYTLCTWIYPELKNQSQVLGGFKDLTGTELNIGINNQNAVFIKIIQKGEEIILNGMDQKLNVNQWSHLALTADVKTKSLHLFLNGVEIVSTALNHTLGYPTTLYFGRSKQNAADGFTGIIDQIELQNDAKNKSWCTFAFSNAMQPLSQWTYGASTSPQIKRTSSDETRKSLSNTNRNTHQENLLKFQTQKQRESSKENTITVSSSATILQQKLQQIQEKVRKEELAKN